MYTIDSNAPEEDVAFFSDPANRYFGLHDNGDCLVAFICFGEDARVPGGQYDGDALDVGCGIRPDQTGQGLGSQVIETAVQFGMTTYGSQAFRATIAAFNERAQRAAKRAGFVPISRFERSSDGMPFVILERHKPGS